MGGAFSSHHLSGGERDGDGHGGVIVTVGVTGTVVVKEGVAVGIGGATWRHACW